MKKLTAFCLTVAGLATLPLASANAHETPASAAAVAAVATLPPTVHENVTVVVGAHGRRHYRVVRRRYRRNGRWVYVSRRAYY